MDEVWGIYFQASKRKSVEKFILDCSSFRIAKIYPISFFYVSHSFAGDPSPYVARCKTTLERS